MRTLTAIFVVPVIVVCGTLLPFAFDSAKHFEDFPSLVHTVVYQYLFDLVFIAAIVVLLRPLWRRWDFMRGWVASATGAMLGCGAMIVFAFAYSRVPEFSSQPITSAGYARGIMTFGITGAVAGYIFWLIADMEMRPNNRIERSRER